MGNPFGEQGLSDRIIVLSVEACEKASGHKRDGRSLVKSDIFDRSLRALARLKPFRPFKVELTSGGQFEVEHPEALSVYAGQAVYFAKDGEIMLFDHESVARLIKPSKSKGPNGKANPS
jgi:hypothetical protein